MFLQSIKLLGFVAIVAAGALGTIVVGQQAKEGRDPGSQSAVNAVASTPQEQAKLVQTERSRSRPTGAAKAKSGGTSGDRQEDPNDQTEARPTHRRRISPWNHSRSRC